MPEKPDCGGQGELTFTEEHRRPFSLFILSRPKFFHLFKPRLFFFFDKQKVL